MEVILTAITPLAVCDQGIGMCWDKQKDEVDVGRMDRVINHNHHESTVEHIVASLEIIGLSRLILQELARHRIASLSVKSTRYTLGELKDEEPFVSMVDGSRTITGVDMVRASKYVNLVDDVDIDTATICALDNLRDLVVKKKPKDKIKYALPEGYKTNLQYTINFRSLRNLLKLRTDAKAHFEFRELALRMFEAVPEEYRFLLEPALYKEPTIVNS